jgi:hypothetical protein
MARDEVHVVNGASLATLQSNRPRRATAIARAQAWMASRGSIQQTIGCNLAQHAASFPDRR